MHMRMLAEINQRFAGRVLLMIDPIANFYGQRSVGQRQVRGNGALVLTAEELYFLRAVPEEEFRVPVSAITGVSTPKSFNHKSAFKPLLCVEYATAQGNDAMAWYVRDLEEWRAAVEGLIG